MVACNLPVTAQPIQNGSVANNTSNDVATAKAILDPLVGYPDAPANIDVATTNNSDPIPVGIVLQRAGSQSAINTVLNGDWADRQSTITSQGSNIW